MDLIERKRIANTKTLPGFNNGEQPKWIDKNAGNVVTAGTSLLNFGVQMNSAGDYNKSQDDLNMQAGQSQSSIGGYGYQIQNAVDASREAEEVKAKNKAETLGLMGSGAATGAAVGSLLGPVGGIVGGAVGGIAGLVGGLFGSKNRERKMREAIRKQQYEAGLRNEFNRARANTSRLSDAYAEENGFDATQYLNTGFAKGKLPVYSPFGKVNAKPDSKVSKGEVAIDTLTGSRYRIPTGPNDTALFTGGKNPYTAIITNKYGLSDIAMNDPETAIALQGALKENGMLGKNKQGYKCGKMPKHKLGLSPYNDDPPFEYEMPWDKEDKQFLLDHRLDDIIDHSITPVTKDGGILNAPTVLGKDKRKSMLNTPATSSKLYGMPGLFMDPTKQYGPIWGGTNMSMPKGSSMADRAPKSPKNTIGLFMDPSKQYGPILGDPIETMKLNPVQSAYNTESSPEFRTPSLTVDVPRVKQQNVSALAPEPVFKYPTSSSLYDDFSKKNVNKILDDQKKHGVKKIKTITPESDRLSWVPNAISSGLGLLAGYNQYDDAKSQSVYKPNTYIRNPYSGKANSILAGLRPNELPTINSILKERDAANYGLANSGGLTTAQKYLGRIATARNSQANIYNALANLQNVHNQYRSAYANSLLLQGAQEAANQMNAMRADNDTYMRGHANRQQGKQTGILNMLAALQQGIANEEKRRMFNKIYGNYVA